jgi:hypothetical protein
VQVQYGIRAVRAAQAGAATFFFFGEQLFGLLRRPAPALHAQMHENRMVTFGAIYGLDVRAPRAPAQHLVRPHTPHATRPRPPTAAPLSAGAHPNPNPNPDPNQVIAQTMKAINAFEVTYNGHLLHSKLATSAFPQQHELQQRLLAIMQAEQSGAAGAAASRPEGQQA